MADNSFSTLRIDPTRYIGLSYNKFRSDLYAQALTDPKAYYKLRQDVEEKLQFQAIGKLYDVLYNCLGEGTDADGVALGFNLPPSVPLQKINEICLSAATTLNEIIEKEVLELLLPLNFEKIMLSRFGEQGRAKTMADI
jgi:hypothetical protein